MTFAEYKRKYRYTQAELCEMYGISMRSCAYWLKDPAMRVKGRSGSRVVVKEKVYAKERPLKPFDE